MDKVQYIKDKFGVLLLFGAELEFYAKAPIFFDPNDSLDVLLDSTGLLIKRETAQDQFEFVTDTFFSKSDLVFDVNFKKQKLVNKCLKNDINLYFLSKPFVGLPGSSFQLSFSFWRDGIDVTLGDDLVECFVFGVLFNLKSYLKTYLPSANCLLRISAIDDIKKYRNSPCNISYGVNNRTTAIRLVKIPPYRLEFRVPSSICDVSKVFDAVLESFAYGLENKHLAKQSSLIKPVFGNAFDYVECESIL